MREASDLSWMAATVQSLETYEAALETAEFPSLIVAALDELLEAPEANAIQLQELADVLLQMIEFPIDVDLPCDTVTTLHSTRDWAVQTLLDVQTAQNQSSKEDTLQSSMSKSLQQTQTKLLVSAPCRQSDVQMELCQALLLAMAEEQMKVLSQVLEMCATKLEDDEQFLQFTEAALSGKTEALTFGTAFMQRLFDRRCLQLQAEEQLIESGMRCERHLFDYLTLESRIQVWANHLPSWQSQLQTWMLEAQRAPFKQISAVVPSGWWFEDSSDGARDTIAVAAACRCYSHLYVTFIEWCRIHVDLLSSCRSMELVGVLSRTTRPENAVCLFKRQLLSQVAMMNYSFGSWTLELRERAFISLGNTLDRLQQTRSGADQLWQYEWIGVLERPELLHEALELLLHDDTDSDMDLVTGEKQSAVRGASQFCGWFYSFPSSESAADIAALLMAMSLELKVLNIRSGAQWLRRSRAEFGTLPMLRLRLVWFWLLKSISIELSMPMLVGENHSTATTVDVLESVEYIFRRFTPPRTKSHRLFQVELVIQLLVELEWRTMKINVKTREQFLDRISPLCAWLTKIVHLMQLEEQTARQNDSRNRSGNRHSPVNDVQHLTQRLKQFLVK